MTSKPITKFSQLKRGRDYRLLAQNDGVDVTFVVTSESKRNPAVQISGRADTVGLESTAEPMNVELIGWVTDVEAALKRGRIRMFSCGKRPKGFVGLIVVCYSDAGDFVPEVLALDPVITQKKRKGSKKTKMKSSV